MSEKGFIGQNLQMPSGVRWGGNGTLADQTGATTCKYLMQITDQNGDPILARQTVKLSLCVCTTAAGTTDAGMGPKNPNFPLVGEIASSLAIVQAATVVIATTAVAAAVDAVKVGSRSPLVATNPVAPLDLAGVIGVHGVVQDIALSGANISKTTFITDDEGKFSFQIVTADAAARAIVVEFASGKVCYFFTVRAA